MGDRDDAIREELRQRLMQVGSRLPTSAMGRLGRIAGTALRGGRLLAFGGRHGDDAPKPPDLDGLVAMVRSLGQLKGVAMKMGQILSYIDLDVPPDLRAALAVLQTHSPPMPFERVAGIVRADLGERADALLAGMSAEPVAAASIGQVHRARLPDGTDVAVKVRYPDIDRAIAGDFRTAAVGTRMASLLFPGAHVDDLVAEARERFLAECDYEREAAAQERFAALYPAHPTLVIPAVHRAFGSPRILVTTWMDGATFDAYLGAGPSQADRDRIGEALFAFYLGSLFRFGLYNCDPHPGNQVFLADGRVAVLDHGCTRDFDGAFRTRLANLTRAVHADERDGLHRAFVDLGMVRDGARYDFDTARSLVRAFYGPMLRDETLGIDHDQVISFQSAFRTKIELMKLRLPGEFLFLFRIRFGLMSILARLGARANWHRLEQGFIAGL
ncbi:MAG TPA: AarF/ABC1/UbiB kinase family protein [Myxococcota bacterium]|nr:AarF/ABC1/UbiB kinase family protein [Myxococcota bacterium]